MRIFNRLKKIQIILIIFLLTSVFGMSLFAQESTGKFKQRLEWNADKNALEYKVEIRSGGKTVQTFTTSDNFVNLNLTSGSYDYRITVYDLLGRVQDVTSWQPFEISKASLPLFNNLEKTADFDVASGNKIQLPVEVENISAGAKVSLVNVKTGKSVAGTLVMQGGAAGLSEVGKAHAEFPLVDADEWKLVVRNPSGLSAESESITITTFDSKAIAAAEAKRLAAEEKEREKLEKEAAELAEKEQKEQEKLEREMAEQAEREEQKRLAEEKAAEEAEQKRMEEIARQEEELAKAEEREKETEERKKRKTVGFEAKGGAALAVNLFDADILNTKTDDPLTNDSMPDNMTLAPYAAISFVPDFGWFIKPGFEVSGGALMFENRSAPFASKPWEYRMYFTFMFAQGNLIAQIPPFTAAREKFFINIKAGGGLLGIEMTSEYYSDERPKKKSSYFYPKLNAGLSLEVVPLKHLVIEAGADYNKVLSSKVNISYLMPYFTLGVRF